MTPELEIIIESQRIIMEFLLAEGRLTSLVSRPDSDGKVLSALKNRLDMLNARRS